MHASPLLVRQCKSALGHIVQLVALSNWQLTAVLAGKT